jgi:hypothetical protein
LTAPTFSDRQREREPYKEAAMTGSDGSHAALSEFETAVKSEVAIWRQAEWGEMRVGYETYLSDFKASWKMMKFPFSCSDHLL